MSEQITITVSDEIYKQIAKQAEQYSYPQSQDHKETKISDIGVGYCLPK
jgi:hypothetical protein